MTRLNMKSFPREKDVLTISIFHDTARESLAEQGGLRELQAVGLSIGRRFLMLNHMTDALEMGRD